MHFGINHEMRDFAHDRKKNLDLVLCTASSGAGNEPATQTLSSLAEDYEIELSEKQQKVLVGLP